ncbi:MAG: hypothetical protein QM504_06850 [Pseudomonadota bacterium]
MHQKTLKTILFFCITLLSCTYSWAKETPNKQWPQEIKTDRGLIVIYQPQPETLNDDKLKARATISIELKNSDKPIFGAIWFTARLQIDRTERNASIADIDINNVRIPDVDEKKLNKLVQLLEKEVPK